MSMDGEVSVEIKPVSVNDAYRVNTKRGYVHSTHVFDDYKENLAWGFKANGIYSNLPRPNPINLDIQYGFKRVHRSDEHLEGYPFRDVTNASKGTLDALEGILYEDDSQVIEITQKKVVSDEPYVKIAWKFIDEKEEKEEKGKTIEKGKGE